MLIPAGAPSRARNIDVLLDPFPPTIAVIGYVNSIVELGSIFLNLGKVMLLIKGSNFPSSNFSRISFIVFSTPHQSTAQQQTLPEAQRRTRCSSCAFCLLFVFPEACASVRRLHHNTLRARLCVKREYFLGR